ncbi:MAG: hypothetical protein LKH52_02605 [Lactobacillus crispatus]|jgi:hypothetical protein|nr:hypothetical protein [Lactobacillus crispatus]MCI1524017.1 hypothetical protein [Lactobacillus crispatus]
MGGINCGQSNGRSPHNGRAGFSMHYAFVMKDVFALNKIYSEANIFLEDLVVNELLNSQKALENRNSVIHALKDLNQKLDKTIVDIKKAELTLEPYFAQKELREGFIEPFRNNKEINESHDFWVENGELPNENSVFNTTVEVLKKKGDLGYLQLLEESIKDLYGVVQSLSYEFASDKTEKEIRKGMFQLAIRDAKNDVTALMTNLTAKLSALFSLVSSYCLLEYTSHTSLTGIDLNFKDLRITSEKNTKKEA